MRNGPSAKHPTELRDPPGAEIRVPIRSDKDIVVARQKAREVAAGIGFVSSDLALIATAVSELARNIVRYAGRGEVSIQPVEASARLGIVLVARDEGPGMGDVDQAMQVGYSTSGGLGLGLPGVRRLMDEFEITSERGRGTSVTIKKWKP
jgi:serine/threonine-protein kinase RsbT